MSNAEKTKRKEARAEKLNLLTCMGSRPALVSHFIRPNAEQGAENELYGQTQ